MIWSLKILFELQNINMAMCRTKKCSQYFFAMTDFKTNGPVYNKNELNSVAFQRSKSANVRGCRAKLDGKFSLSSINLMLIV